MAESAKGRPLIPFYMVMDVSFSMSSDMDDVNKAIDDIGAEVAKSAVISDVARFGLIEFADQAAELIPLMDFEQIDDLPNLVPKGGTNYGNVFKLLKTTIERDVKTLLSSGFHVHRPTVFFVTDGEPLDSDWQKAFSDLTTYDKTSRKGFEYYPQVVPFGLARRYQGGADTGISSDTLKALVHPPGRSRGFMFDMKAGPAFGQIKEILMGTILSTGSSEDADGGTGVNWDAVDMDDVDHTDGTDDDDNNTGAFLG